MSFICPRCGQQGLRGSWSEGLSNLPNEPRIPPLRAVEVNRQERPLRRLLQACFLFMNKERVEGNSVPGPDELRHLSERCLRPEESVIGGVQTSRRPAVQPRDCG